jgi:hypothetical protein
VNKFLQTLAKVANSKELSLANSELGEEKSVRGVIKTLVKLASGFLGLHAKPKFHLRLASWRVVIRTPGV